LGTGSCATVGGTGRVSRLSAGAGRGIRNGVPRHGRVDPRRVAGRHKRREAAGSKDGDTENRGSGGEALRPGCGGWTPAEMRKSPVCVLCRQGPPTL